MLTTKVIDLVINTYNLHFHKKFKKKTNKSN